jgi:hypothetical protein
MAACVKTYPDGLLVTLTCNGEAEPEQSLARTPEAALKAAVLLLAKRDALYPGDALTVAEA